MITTEQLYKKVLEIEAAQNQDRRLIKKAVLGFNKWPRRNFYAILLAVIINMVLLIIHSFDIHL